MSETDGAAPELLPIGDWVQLPKGVALKSKAVRLPGGRIALASETLHAAVGHALRADSPDAPSTHAEAVAAGEKWSGHQLGLDAGFRKFFWKSASKRKKRYLENSLEICLAEKYML